MAIAVDKLLIIVSLIFCLTMFIGTIGVESSETNRFENSDREKIPIDLVRWMSKRRFLPTRDAAKIVDQQDSDDIDSHSKEKRYFLKSKRYFLNSKRDQD